MVWKKGAVCVHTRVCYRICLGQHVILELRFVIFSLESWMMVVKIIFEASCQSRQSEGRVFYQQQFTFHNNQSSFHHKRHMKGSKQSGNPILLWCGRQRLCV